MLTDTDQRVVLRDLSWQQFLAGADARGERGNPRLHFQDGLLELMHSSRGHEYRKCTIARCLETWATLMGVPLQGYGSYTIMNRAERCAAEADDCYVIGDSRRGPPDLVIEQRAPDSEIDQGKLYQRLGVRELWLWDARRIHRHRLAGGRRLDLDLELIDRCARAKDQTSAVRMLCRAIEH